MIKEIVSVGTMVAIACTLLGCDNGPTTETVPATGMVTMDGEPIEGVSVTLMPEAGVEGSGGYGITDSEGKFSLQTSPEVEGVAPGKYRVLFQKLTLADGSPIPPDAMAADVEAVNQIPERYRDPEGEHIVADIPAGGATELTFELTSR